MTARKSRKCPVCEQKFKRPHNVTLHMKTAHRTYVKKMVCTICKKLISTNGNMRVHLKREGIKNKKKYSLRNGKINGKVIKLKWVPANTLQHGRFYGAHISDSSEYSECDELPLAQLIRVIQSNEPLPVEEVLLQADEGIFCVNNVILFLFAKRIFSNKCSKFHHIYCVTIWFIDELFYSSG